MAFIGLEQKFDQTYKKLYHTLPLKTSDGEPFLTFTPDDPEKEEVLRDTRFSPIGSEKRDLERLGGFLTSSKGKLFLLNQAELQTGNTFSETRIIDPLFVVGNVPGVIHIRRSLGSAADIPITAADASPAASSPIGSAGRLQLETKQTAISNLMGSQGAFGLFNLLPPNDLSIAVSAVRSVLDQGIEGVDDRPELDFNGQFFSVAMWRGFKPQSKPGNPLDAATTALQQGNFEGAVNAIRNGFNQVIKGVNPISQTLIGNNRGDPNDTTLDGYRYFIIDSLSDDGVDRYIADAVHFKSINNGISGKSISVPVSNVNFAKKFTPLTGNPVQPTRISQVGDTVTSPQVSQLTTGGQTSAPLGSAAQNLVSQTQSQANSLLIRSVRSVGSSLDIIGGALFGSSAPLPFDKLTEAFLRNNNASALDIELNPAQSKMTYPDLSLQSRYQAMLASLQGANKDYLDAAAQVWQQTYINLQSSDTRTYGVSRRTLGIEGGFRPGDVIPSDIGQKRIKYDPGDPTQRGRYFHDPMNEMNPIISVDPSLNEPGDDIVQSIRNITGNLIDLTFFDFVNSKVIPFRAFITEIAENVTPNVSEQQYIGRIERNIIYLGVLRELSFSLRIQAFNPDEMKNIWTKINYLTGMTFPSTYSNGFLVPPFVKLTMGNIYVDQPGYIKSLSYKFDDDSWEIDEGFQAPMGITVNVTFSVIEKRQMQTNSSFYPFGQAREVTPRNTAMAAPRPDNTSVASIPTNTTQTPSIAQIPKAFSGFFG